MKAKKKHGWVLQAGIGKFVKPNFDESRTLGLAKVWPTRNAARKATHLIGDMVRKVELTRSGVAKKIIAGR